MPKREEALVDDGATPHRITSGMTAALGGGLLPT